MKHNRPGFFSEIGRLLSLQQGLMTRCVASDLSAFASAEREAFRPISDYPCVCKAETSLHGRAQARARLSEPIENLSHVGQDEADPDSNSRASKTEAQPAFCR